MSRTPQQQQHQQRHHLLPSPHPQLHPHTQVPAPLHMPQAVQAVLGRQRGGTAIGFIFGLVLGLGAALGVAVYVTKVPVPFLNKGASRSATQDAAEAQKNRNWDPNSPLYGKNPARPPAPVVSGVVGTEPAPAAGPADPDSGATGAPVAATGAPPFAPAAGVRPAAPATPATAPPTTVAKAAPLPSPRLATDPLGDLARSRDKADAAASAAAADPFNYFVQAGAFRTQQDADAQRAKLAMMGWEARVSEREQNGRTVYRVRVGPFGKRDDAQQIKEKLDGAAVDSALVRAPR